MFDPLAALSQPMRRRPRRPPSGVVNPQVQMPEVAPPTLPPRQTLPSAQMQLQPPEVQMPPVGVPSQEEDPFATFLGLFTDREPKELVPIPLPPEKTGIDPEGAPEYRGLVPPVPEATAVSAPAVSVAPGGVAPEAAQEQANGMAGAIGRMRWRQRNVRQANGMVGAIDFTGDPEQIFSQMQAAVDFATANEIVVLGGNRFYYDANGERVAVPIIKFGQQGEWIQLENADDLSGLTPAGSLRADDDPGSTFIVSGIGDFFDDLGDFRSVRPGSWVYNFVHSRWGDFVGKMGDFFDMGGGFLNPFDERPPEVPSPVGPPGVGEPPGYSAAPTDGSMVPPVPKPLNPTDQGGQVFYPVVGSDWAGSQPMGEDAGSGYRYGDAPHGEASDYRHNAVDIQGAEGSGIASTVSGEVITIDFDPVSYGLHIRIRDAQGRVHLYAHLQSISPELQVGARVQGGQSIGAMGGVPVDRGGTYQLHSSITLGSDERLGPGRSTGSHLHYEVQDGQGNPIDPGTFLPGASPSSGASTAVSASNLDSQSQAQMGANSQGPESHLSNFSGEDQSTFFLTGLGNLYEDFEFNPVFNAIGDFFSGETLPHPDHRTQLPGQQPIPSLYQGQQGFFGGEGGGRGQGPWMDPQGDPNYRPMAQPGQDGFGSWLDEQRQRPGMESLLGPEAFPFRTQDRINNFQPTPWDTAARHITAAKRGLGYVVGGDMVGDLYTGYLEHVRRDPERAQAERDRGANPPPQGWIGEHIDAPIGEFARNAYEAITETPLSVFPYRGMAGRTSDTPAGPTLSDIGERMEWRDPEGNVAIGPPDIAFAALGAKPVLRAGAYQAGRAVGWADQVAARAAQAAGARRAAQARAAAPDAIPATRGAARLPEPYIEGEVTVLGEQRLLPGPAFAEPLRPPPPRTRQIPGRQAAAELQRPPPSGQAIIPEPPPSAIPPTIPPTIRSAFPLMPVPPRGQIGLGEARASISGRTIVLHAGPGESFMVIRDGILNATQYHYPQMGAGTAIILFSDGAVAGAVEHSGVAQWIVQQDPNFVPGVEPVQYVLQRGGIRYRQWDDNHIIEIAPEPWMSSPEEAGRLLSEQLAKGIAFSIESAGGIEAVLTGTPNASASPLPTRRTRRAADDTISWEVSYGQKVYGVGAYEYPQGYDLNMGEVARTGINEPQWHIRVTPEMIAKHLPEVRSNLVRTQADLRPKGIASRRSVNLNEPPDSIYAAMARRVDEGLVPWHEVAPYFQTLPLRVQRMRDALDAFMDDVRTSPNFDLKALNYLRDLRNGVQMGAVGRDLMGYQQIEDGVVRALFESTTGGSRTEGRFGRQTYGLDLRNMTEKLRVAHWAMEKVNSVEAFQSAWSHIQRQAGINSKLARQNFSQYDALGREAELLFSMIDLFVRDGLTLGEIINIMGGGSYVDDFALPIARAIRQQNIRLDPDTKPMQQLLLRRQPGYNYMRSGQENLDAIPNTEPLTPRDVMPQEIEYPPQGDFDQYQLDTRHPMPLDERRWSDVDAGESLMDPRSARVTEDYTRLVLKYRFLTTKDSGPRPRMSARSYSQSGLVARHRAGMSKAESAARDETLRQAMDHIKLAREYWAQDAIDAALSAHADAERLLRKLPEFVEIERLLSEADALAELLSEASIDPNFDEIIGIDGAADLLERETDIFDEFLLTTEHAIFDRGVQSDNPGVHAALPADLAKLRRFHGVLERMYDRLMGRPPEEFMPGGGGAGGIMLPPQAAALSAAPVGASGMWS